MRRGEPPSHDGGYKGGGYKGGGYRGGGRYGRGNLSFSGDFSESGSMNDDVMKKFLLSLSCAALVSVPAFACSCPSSGGCGDGGGNKSKDGDEGKGGAKQPLVIRVQE